MLAYLSLGGAIIAVGLFLYYYTVSFQKAQKISVIIKNKTNINIPTRLLSNLLLDYIRLSLFGWHPFYKKVSAIIAPEVVALIETGELHDELLSIKKVLVKSYTLGVIGMLLFFAYLFIFRVM